MGKLNKKGLEKKLEYKKEMKEKRKGMKDILRLKRAKLIVRNISFRTKEEDLKSLFGQYGDVESVTILKKDDGKMVGCAFIQYKAVQNAAKARHHLNGQTFLKRDIEVDFAKPKNKYSKLKQKKPNDKKEENPESTIVLD